MWRNNSSRTHYGQYYHLFPEIRKHKLKFNEYLRMSVKTFDHILNSIQGLLQKKWCNLHSDPILPEEKLVITLRFLATGESYASLALTFGIGKSTVLATVVECMDAIWNNLQPLHMPCPTELDFRRISEIFYKKFKFPNCLGAIDGRRIRIKKPPHSGTAHFNYKKYYSMVLQAHVDAEYRYITIDICHYGSQSDAGIFSYSKLKKAIDNQLLQLPKGKALPLTNTVTPYYFVGDGAYPLSDIMMKPFRGFNLKEEEKNFNTRLSKARVVVENAFAKTCQKWRIFYTVIDCRPGIVEKIIKATCVLHNIILNLQLHDGTVGETFYHDIVGDEQTDSAVCTREEKRGQEVRRTLVQYLMDH